MRSRLPDPLIPRIGVEHHRVRTQLAQEVDVGLYLLDASVTEWAIRRRNR
ncbi:hypothetical protein [Rhodococcus sp. H29-C3]|nr:hypothetical protein [Rhodococcus sp. H29-C3]MDJ0362300.1 hypothetical protein [Rhodococcus sp. H29-C3]